MMDSLIDILTKTTKRHTIIEPKKKGQITISGGDKFTELFNIKGFGTVKSLSIYPDTCDSTDIKIEIDGKTVYDSSTADNGFIYTNGIYLIFGDKNNFRIAYNGSSKIDYYTCYTSTSPSALCDSISINSLYMFDTSVNNIATIPESYFNKNTAFLSDGGIEFKESFIVSAKRRSSTSEGYIYAGIEYMML